jgi:hypothetical protein
MNIAIILLAFTTIINALHISYIYKELSKRIDKERMYLIDLIHNRCNQTEYEIGVNIQKIINDIKSGKLKKDPNKKKQD